MRTPRRVVAALHVAEPSGPSRSLQPVLERLARDASVVVAVPGPGGAADELAHVARIEVTGHGPLMFPRGPRDLVTLAPRLRAEVARFRGLLRRERADLVLVATTQLPAVTLAARLEHVPAIVYAAELYRQGSRLDPVRSRVGRGAVRLNERLASVTVPCSRAVAEQLRRPQRAVVVYPAIDPAVADGDAAAFRERHGLTGDGPYLATLGSITRGRGQDVALRALQTVLRRHPSARLVVGGVPHPRATDAAYSARLDALAARLGVADRVHRVGFVRPGDLYAAVDVVLNPARTAETFGIVAAEALVAGTPVVSTSVGAVPEILRDGEHVLLVPPDRPDALAEAVLRVLGDRALADRLVAAGRSHVLSSFNAESQLPRFQAAIDAAMASANGNGRRPG
jgi:glycosyltransferase involved in cell wall biosynthesis